MIPEQALFQSHLEAIPFQSGADRGRWGFPGGEPLIEWPHCKIWVQSDKRFAAAGKVILRFTVDGYSAEAPNAIPWDLENNQPLPKEQWPAGSSRVSAVFKPSWKITGLYCPCDRVPISDHPKWKTQDGMSQWFWTADSDITLYLEFLHRCLNPRTDEG